MDGGEGVLTLHRKPAIARDHGGGHADHVADQRTGHASAPQAHHGGPAQSMHHKARFPNRRKGGARIAFSEPLIAQLRSAEWATILFEQDEAWRRCQVPNAAMSGAVRGIHIFSPVLT
jgi:hypothetical protein